MELDGEATRETAEAGEYEERCGASSEDDEGGLRAIRKGRR
jgi:hypothetical protein